MTPSSKLIILSDLLLLCNQVNLCHTILTLKDMSHTHIKVYTLSDMNVSYHTEVIEHVALGHKVSEVIHIRRAASFI